MTLLPPPGKGQVLALCLLFIAGTLVYFLGFSNFFSERAAVNSEIASLLETQQIARAKLAQKPKLEKRIADVSQFEAANTYFLATRMSLAVGGLPLPVEFDVAYVMAQYSDANAATGTPQYKFFQALSRLP